MYSLKFAKSFLASGLNYADGLGPVFYAKLRNTEFQVDNISITVRRRADEARFETGLFANIRLWKNILMVYYRGNK